MGVILANDDPIIDIREVNPTHVGVILTLSAFRSSEVYVNPTHVGVIPAAEASAAAEVLVNPTHVGVILRKPVKSCNKIAVNPTHVGVIPLLFPSSYQQLQLIPRMWE